MLSINSILIISIIFFGNDAKTIMLLFLIELMINTFFRSVKMMLEAEKGKPGKLSERAKILTNMIFIMVALFAMILIAGTLNWHGHRNISEIWPIIEQNMLIIISMIFIEAISLTQYFYVEIKKGKIIEYGYAKILLAIALIFIFSPLYGSIMRTSETGNEGLMLLAIICVLSKTYVDYWVIKRESITS